MPTALSQTFNRMNIIDDLFPYKSLMNRGEGGRDFPHPSPLRTCILFHEITSSSP
jgi:hypothetical protein